MASVYELTAEQTTIIIHLTHGKMKTTEKHMLEALKTFVGADYLQSNLDALDCLKRSLALAVMNEDIDADMYDKYCWLLWRFEDLLKELKTATDTTQIFHERQN